MSLNIKLSKKPSKSDAQIFLCDNKSWQKHLPFKGNQAKFVKNQIAKKNRCFLVPMTKEITFVACFDLDKIDEISRENARLVGAELTNALNKLHVDSAFIHQKTPYQNATLLCAEGMALANYQFLKYRTEKKELKNSLATLRVGGDAKASAVTELNNIVAGVYLTRTLVNEPLMYLTAPQIAKEIQKAGKVAGFKVTVFNKKKIQSLKMGGLIAVNLGSVDPPTFSILEHKPKKAKNKKPIILVGKGVVYDTGGLSLKPTANSMDFMKCDMGGAGAVIGAMYAIAKNKLPYHVIALVPATDNRPGLNAYVPGDVITMHSGKTVEVLNTDAEGRMLLADALSFAKKYKPELVIDLATLTGSASRAVGPFGIAMMGTAKEKTKRALKRSGDNTYERLVEFPLWKEYGGMLKSDIADVKNIGGPSAGMITAGKFLEHFTDYPWIHLDIAPVAWSTSTRGYVLKNGSGSPVRLLYDFIKNKTNNESE